MRKSINRLVVFLMLFLMFFSLGNFSFYPTGNAEEVTSAIPANSVRIYYERADNDFENLGLWIWDDVAEPSSSWPTDAMPFQVGQKDRFGAYVDVPLAAGANKIGFLVVDRESGEKDGGDKSYTILSPDMNEVGIKQGSDEVFPLGANGNILAENTVRIHYVREDASYEEWGLWIWDDVANPSENWPSGAEPFTEGSHGAYVDIQLKEDAQKIGFLVVNRNDGQQTGDMSFTMLDEFKQLWIREGDEKVYVTPDWQSPIGLLSGELISDQKITVKFTSTSELDAEQLQKDLTVVNKDGEEVSIASVSIINDSTVEINGEFDLEKLPFKVIFEGKTITANSGWRLIDELYGYDGELGATLHADGTATLKLWSPMAESINVILYDKNDQFAIVKDDIEMIKGERGVWEVTLNEATTGVRNVRGYYYHYEIEHGGEKKLALDPYAKSMATWNNLGEYPIGKAAIVDPATIGPELDFAKINGFEKREDAIIYEIHVRDFTSDPSIEAELSGQFGTFAAFTDKLDYIADLGVTHVQLLPVMSYFWGDEWASSERILDYISTGTNYNWGYDPHSYFSLSGMYSENPDDPELRIKEFKTLVNEIHNRGMGVVLDVVYNHTARVNIFEDLAPNYYHFMDADGTPRTSFGGGRLGTTHKMARRILVDSITYWVNEFKVDGFRFDMMGDHDAESIQEAYDKAKELNPNIIMIGEGWRTFVGDEGERDIMPADQDWMQHTESVGSFSDEFRNELKSGFGSEGEPRFITGGPRNIKQIFDNIKAQPHNFVATHPGDVVPYIEAHDNLTLHDVIAQSIKKDPEFYEQEIHERIRIGNAMVLTAQGKAFIHAGQEFGRTKQFRADTTEAPYKSTYMEDENGVPFTYPYFIHDSYDSSDIINMFDWNKATNREAYPIHNLTRDYTTGLIELRKSTDAFRLGSKELIDTNVTLINAPEIQAQDLVIGYRNEATNGDAYYVFVNADTKARVLSLDLDLTEGVVVVDKDEAGVVAVANPTGFELSSEQITIEPLTTIVVKVASEDGAAVPTPETPENNNLMNWLFVVLAVLVAGAIAFYVKRKKA
jgi:pullulanase